jgi:alkylmercury lyase
MMNQVSLEELARAIAAADPELDAEGQRIFVQTLRLLARGEPVWPAEIAEAAAVSPEGTEETLRSWPGVFWDDQGRVVRFWGLSIDRLNPAHQIDVNGRRVYGWCAWDTLFITEILGMETQVESTDLVTRETVRLTVTPEGVAKVDPNRAVVSFLFPNGPWGSDVIQSFCHYVHFFASPESGRIWTADHPGTFLLSMDEAFELGRLTNRLRAPEIIGGRGTR